MKITEMAKVMGPVFMAQYMYRFEVSDKSNPYEIGTQSHASFMEEMSKLELEAPMIDFPSPEGQAWSDFVEGVDENPYFPGSNHDKYDVEMSKLMLGGDK